MWGSVFHSLWGHERFESPSRPPYLSLAWGGARDGEDISEHHSLRIIWERRTWRTHRSERTDYKDRRSVGKPARRLLEVRAAVGRDLEAKVPAMDENRTTETARLDSIAHLAGGDGVAPTLADLSTRYAASARSQRADEIQPGGGVHIRAEEIQKWIDRGLLRSRTAGTSGLQRQIIDAEDSCDFCKRHRREIVGYRLNADPLRFVQTFVFPSSHMELLPVREAKKEQAAYEEQMKKEADWQEDIEADDELGATA